MKNLIVLFLVTISFLFSQNSLYASGSALSLYKEQNNDTLVAFKKTQSYFKEEVLIIDENENTILHHLIKEDNVVGVKNILNDIFPLKNGIPDYFKDFIASFLFPTSDRSRQFNKLEKLLLAFNKDNETPFTLAFQKGNKDMLEALCTHLEEAIHIRKGSCQSRHLGMVGSGLINISPTLMGLGVMHYFSARKKTHKKLSNIIDRKQVGNSHDGHRVLVKSIYQDGLYHGKEKSLAIFLNMLKNERTQKIENSIDYIKKSKRGLKNLLKQLKRFYRGKISSGGNGCEVYIGLPTNVTESGYYMHSNYVNNLHAAVLSSNKDNLRKYLKVESRSRITNECFREDYYENNPLDIAIKYKKLDMFSDIIDSISVSECSDKLCSYLIKILNKNNNDLNRFSALLISKLSAKQLYKYSLDNSYYDGTLFYKRFCPLYVAVKTENRNVVRLLLHKLTQELALGKEINFKVIKFAFKKACFLKNRSIFDVFYNIIVKFKNENYCPFDLDSLVKDYSFLKDYLVSAINNNEYDLAEKLVNLDVDYYHEDIQNLVNDKSDSKWSLLCCDRRTKTVKSARK